MPYRTQFWVPAPLEEVWNFHSDVSNLKVISPDALSIEWLSQPQFALNFEFEFQSSLLVAPLAQTWRLKFVEIQDQGMDRYFVDEALKSPFKKWRHKHRFYSPTLAKKQSGTWIIDEIDYELSPLQSFGSSFVKKFFNYMFQHRQKRLQQEFQTN